MTDDLTGVFEEVYAGPASRVQSEVLAAAMGEEYPVELDTYSWISRTELRTIADAAAVGPGDVLLDVGCGRGGPGLWVAAATGCDLVGLDIAENAVVAAGRRAEDLGLAERAHFRTGTFEDTGCADGSAAALMSVDAFLFSPDKAAAAHEVARVVRPGGRWVMTSWDFDGLPPNRPPQVDDHRPLAEAAGFEVLHYDATDDWAGRMQRSLDGFRARVDELAAEAGSPVEEVRAGIEDMGAIYPFIRRRFLMVAQRRG